MRREYPNPLGTRVRFNFSSPLNMSRITNKYMRVGDGDGVRQNPSPPRPIAMLTYISFYKITKTLFFLICSLSFLIFSLSNKLNNIYIYIYLHIKGQTIFFLIQGTNKFYGNLNILQFLNQRVLRDASMVAWDF